MIQDCIDAGIPHVGDINLLTGEFDHDDKFLLIRTHDDIFEQATGKKFVTEMLGFAKGREEEIVAYNEGYKSLSLTLRTQDQEGAITALEEKYGKHTPILMRMDIGHLEMAHGTHQNQSRGPNDGPDFM